MDSQSSSFKCYLRAYNAFLSLHDMSNKILGNKVFFKFVRFSTVEVAFLQGMRFLCCEAKLPNLN